MSGQKYDGGKPDYSLIPAEAIEALAQLYTLGAKKYGRDNWREGFKWSRVFAAMMRHSWCWMMGEKFDQADGQHHLIAVAWNAFALYIHEIHDLGEDDRYKQAKPRS